MTSFLLTLLLANSLQAQDTIPNVKILDNQHIKEITVVGSLKSNLTLPLIEIDRKTLDVSSFFTPTDALQRETGLSLVRDGIWATSVNIRGLSEQRLIFLVDGDRIQTSSDIAGALSTVDMASLQKIEILKGSGSVLYGSGSMGGIVNFVSARPTYTDQNKFSGYVATEFNTVNSLWGNNANFNFSTNQWYVALTGSYRTADNTQSAKGEIKNSQFNDASWGLKAGIKYTPNEEFLVNYQHLRAWDVGLPGGSAFPSTASVRYKKIERNQLSAEYIITDVNDYLSKISLKGFSQNVTRDVENIVNPTLTYLPGSINKTYGGKIVTDWNLAENQSLVLGAEGWERRTETLRLKKDYFSDGSNFYLKSITGQQPIANARMLDLGTFAHYSWRINPKRLTMNAGLRLDYLRTANDSAFNPIFQMVPSAQSSMYQSTTKTRFEYVKNLDRKLLFVPEVSNEFSYAAHVDLVYTLSRVQFVSLSVSNSYRSASIDERFKFIELGTTARVGNPDLKPEKANALNLNYTLNTKNTRFKTDLFLNSLFDLITEKPGTYQGRSVLINTNVARALFVGAEMEFSSDFNRYFSFLANASYTRARDVDADSPLPQIPPLSGFASFNYQSGSLLEASVSSLWAASQTEVASNETTTKGHAIFNLDIHTTPIKLRNSFLQFYGGVNNIFNTAYYNHLTSTRNGGVKYYEPGINIYLKTKLNF